MTYYQPVLEYSIYEYGPKHRVPEFVCAWPPDDDQLGGHPEWTLYDDLALALDLLPKPAYCRLVNDTGPGPRQPRHTVAALTPGPNRGIVFEARRPASNTGRIVVRDNNHLTGLVENAIRAHEGALTKSPMPS